MTGNNTKPLKPLQYGNVLIVGGKASNFDEDLRNHPRVILWDSQNEHWTSKDVPQNVRAIFITRWIGHAAFGKIHAEARKKGITIFNPEGTGMIMKQIKELLDMNKPVEPLAEKPVVEETMPKSEPIHKPGTFIRKLDVLHPFIDFSMGNMDNARVLLVKAGEMGIETTFGSLAQMVSVRRRKVTGKGLQVQPTAKIKKVHQVHLTNKQSPDVVVQMLDGMIKELQDMREYLVAVTEENKTLRTRINNFKKLWED